MPRIQYDLYDWSPHASTLRTIHQAQEIVADYLDQGFRLTLRQLYYQFVARDLIPNNQRSYKRLGDVIGKARLAGMLDWQAIEDRTRSLRQLNSWADGADYIVPDGYRSDWWADQGHYVEVWVEKEALSGVFWSACAPLHVPVFAAKGYPSLSEMWRAAGRLNARRKGGRAVVLHFGDHDPSGIDMTRDLEDRLWRFGTDVEIRRLALNMDQVEEYDPPPNPAKITDSRAEDYISRYGRSSWELDALEPRVLSALIEEEVGTMIDSDAWETSREHDEEERRTLRLVERHYDQVADFVRGL